MKKNATLLTPLFILLLFTECVDTDPPFDQGYVDGYSPVYGAQSIADIALQGPSEVNIPGKIYIYGKYLLVNESGKGIHIFNNEDPGNPQNLGFIQMMGNSDMAIKDGILYADHAGDLVALSIHDFSFIEEKGRLSLDDWNLGAPPPAGFYFECVDPDKGLVIAWKKVTLKNPDCYATR